MRASQSDQPTRAELEAEVAQLRRELRAIYQSRLYRIVLRIWAARRRLRGARNAGPRQVGLGHLFPYYHLEAGEQPTTWRSTGIDPQFLAPCRLRRGWAHVRLSCKSSVPGRVDLYLDTGRGFNQRERVELSDQRYLVELDGFVRFPRRVRAIRFDPLDRAGQLSLTQFSIEHVSAWHFWTTAWRTWYRDARGLRTRGRIVSEVVSRALRFDLGTWLDDIKARQTIGLLSESIAYARWRARRALSRADRRRIRSEIAQWSHPPLISIVVPVFNPPLPYLKKCIASVQKQLYPYWELCLADDCSPDPEVRQMLRRYAARDSRIKVAYRTSNGNISAASNSALALATGEYVALLDNDDELAAHALYRMAREIMRNPALDLIYSDEDKIDTVGHHFDPFFKPDWSPEFLLACMYSGHLSVYRRSIVEAVGGFRSAYDGSQDYDLVLRVSQRTDRILHVPDILYHWRTLPTSAAASTAAKPKAYQAAVKALQAHLSSVGQTGEVEHGPSLGYYRVRYKIDGEPRVDIVITTAPHSDREGGRITNAHATARTLERLASRANYPNVTYIVVGQPALLDVVAKNTRVPFTPVPVDQRVPLAGRANLGAKAGSGEMLLFVRECVQPKTRDWLTALLEFAQVPGVGAVGGKHYFRDGRLRHVGLTVTKGRALRPFYGFPGDFPGYCSGNLVYRNCVAVSATCLMTRRPVFEALGGFSPRAGETYDVNYCLRLRVSKQRVVFTPYSEILDESPAIESERAQPLARGIATRDPWYNPNLASDIPLYVVDAQSDASA